MKAGLPVPVYIGKTRVYSRCAALAEVIGKLDGFDAAFTQADKNKDGKLDRDEFKAAWAIYTGKPQG